jgi:large subunit ribosomal protein L17
LPSADEVEFNRYGEVRKAPRLIQHILTRVAPLYKDRAGGYTRIVKLDKRRLGDATDLVVLQLVGGEEGPQVKGRKSTRRTGADKRTAFAKKAREKAAAAKG